MFKALGETVNEKLNNLENDGNAQGEQNPPGKWTETRETKVPGKHEQRSKDAGCPKGEQSHANE